MASHRVSTRICVFAGFAYACLIGVGWFQVYVLDHLEGALGGHRENFVVGVVVSLPIAALLALGFSLPGVNRNARECMRRSGFTAAALSGILASALFFALLSVASLLFSSNDRTTVEPDKWWAVDWLWFTSSVLAALAIGAAAGLALVAVNRHSADAA